MWGTDLTSTLTGEGQASVFVTVDHCSTECVGIHAARRATRFEALEPLRQGVRACFGAFAAGVAGGLKLRHDHGSQFVADDYQRELAFLGIESSPAFVREPEGNGCVERFIRTLKENLLWVHRFETIDELRLALHRVQGDLQPDLDRRAPRLQDPGGRQSGAARAAPGSRMNLQRGVSRLWTATPAPTPIRSPRSGASSKPSPSSPRPPTKRAPGSASKAATAWRSSGRTPTPTLQCIDLHRDKPRLPQASPSIPRLQRAAAELRCERFVATGLQSLLA